MEDVSGNRRPHKAKSIDRIDPAVAAIMSAVRAAANASMLQGTLANMMSCHLL